jgi:predicted MFS family arabinose efflux permease
VLAGFGAGGLIYSITVTRLVPTLGERGMAAVGGALMAIGFAGFALTPAWPASFLAAVALGLGFYMHHATLQTNATQMAPEARGFAIGLFAFSLYVSQAIGVALCGVVIEALGYRWMFGMLAPAVLTLGLCYAASLPRRNS